MIINEIFYSIQGEGLLTGVPSVFIRLAGCPLRCRWCDTKYAQSPSAGVDLTIPQLLHKIENLKYPAFNISKKNKINSAFFAVKNNYIVLTGGEPMTNPQLPALTKALKKLGKHITIETAGIKFIPNLACDLMSISPKTSNAGLAAAGTPASSKKGMMRFTAIKRLIENYPYQLKFVVRTPRDLPEIRKIVESLGQPDPARVLLMPQAKTRRQLINKSEMVAELCRQTGFTFCTRLHILLFNGQKGK